MNVIGTPTFSYNTSLRKPDPPQYPSELRRFDKNDQSDTTESIFDEKISTRIAREYENGKMLWEATNSKSKFLVDIHIAHCHAQLLAKTQTTLARAKSLSGTGQALVTTFSSSSKRLHRYRHLIPDKEVIQRLYTRHFTQARTIFEQNLAHPYWNFSDYCHPFVSLVLSQPPDIALEEIGSPEYQKYKNNFVHTSTAEKRDILRHINKSYGNQMLLRRYSININPLPPDYAAIPFNHFRNDLKVILHGFAQKSNNRLRSAICSFSPSAITFDGHLMEDKIGHMCLLFTPDSAPQNRELLLRLNDVWRLIENTELRIIPILDDQQGYVGQANGMVSRSQKSMAMLDNLASFMTLERRYLKPGFLASPHIPQRRFPSVPDTILTTTF